MNSTAPFTRGFPLSGGSALRATSRPRPLAPLLISPGLVMGNRAFMRAWAARRAAKSAGLTSLEKRQP